MMKGKPRGLVGLVTADLIEQPFDRRLRYARGFAGLADREMLVRKGGKSARPKACHHRLSDPKKFVDQLSAYEMNRSRLPGPNGAKSGVVDGLCPGGAWSKVFVRQFIATGYWSGSRAGRRHLRWHGEVPLTDGWSRT